MLNRYDKILDTPLHPEAAADAAAAAAAAADEHYDEEAEQLPVVPEYPLDYPEDLGTRDAARQRPVGGGGEGVHASVVRLRRQRADRAELDAEAARRAARGEGGGYSSMYEAYSSFEIERNSEPGMADAEQLDSGAILGCANNKTRAAEILVANARATIAQVNMTGTPWVLVDGVPLGDDADLLGAVCDAFTGAPPAGCVKQRRASA